MGDEQTGLEAGRTGIQESGDAFAGGEFAKLMLAGGFVRAASQENLFAQCVDLFAKTLQPGTHTVIGNSSNYMMGRRAMTFPHQKTAEVFLTLLVCAAAAWAAYSLRQLLFLLVLALFVAYTLEPLIRYTQRIAPKAISRNVAITAVYLAVLLVGGISIAWLGNLVTAQALALAAKLPEAATNPAKFSEIALPEQLEPFRDDVLKFGIGLAETAARGILGGIGNAGLALLVPIFALYFLKDGRLIANAFLSFAGQLAPTQGVRGTLNDLHDLLSKYIRAILLLSFFVFVTHAMFFQFMAVPYGLLLATLAAVFELIPVLGWISAGFLAVVIAALSGYPHWGWLLVFLLLFRLFQDYVVVPALMAHGIELHPLAVLAGVIAGEFLAGIPGMFLSIPAMAAGRIVYRRWRSTAVELSPDEG
jgi:predicted PurR-regulated permease PerM